MTFDDGILTIFCVTNRGEPGKKPVPGLEQKARYYYGIGDLGIIRYYQALQAEQQISMVVNIPGWNDVKTTDVCILDDTMQYDIRMVQPMLDEAGLRMMRLSLERRSQDYEVPG